jgi:6-phosphogluconate dehydrogenase (decarboxylating)
VQGWEEHQSKYLTVLATALFERFASRGNDDYANKVLAAMRLGFGGHIEGGA